jgi:P-type Cu+ transporter
MTETTTPEKVVIPVSGMTCAACSGRVQRTLSKQPGVQEAAVNLMTGSATIEFDPAATSPDALVEAIRSTGYGAELASTERTAFEEQEAQGAAQGEEFRALRLRALVSLAAAAVAMLLSMPLMDTGDHGHASVDPFMRWAMGWVSPALEGVAPWLYRVPAPVLSWTLRSG